MIPDGGAPCVQFQVMYRVLDEWRVFAGHTRDATLMNPGSGNRNKSLVNPLRHYYNPDFVCLSVVFG